MRARNEPRKVVSATFLDATVAKDFGTFWTRPGVFRVFKADQTFQVLHDGKARAHVDRQNVELKLSSFGIFDFDAAEK